MLRPDINLYSADLRPRTEPLTGRHLVVVGLGLLVLLAGLAGLPLLDRMDLQDDLVQLRTLVAVEEKRTADFRERYRNVEPDPALGRELAAVTADRDATAAWLRLVVLEDGANRRGFSGYLEDLAVHRVSGLWLTGIHLEAGGQQIALEGNTAEPAYVPRYLDRLGGDSGFAGKAFRALQMASPDEGGALRFSVSTLAPGNRAAAEAEGAE